LDYLDSGLTSQLGAALLHNYFRDGKHWLKEIHTQPRIGKVFPMTGRHATNQDLSTSQNDNKAVHGSYCEWNKAFMP